MLANLMSEAPSPSNSVALATTLNEVVGEGNGDIFVCYF